ncbi:GNAT family N-acetyltransferase [Nonomuraea sp. NPDC050404]|uniref:GNAT family N-acetyltransferase n=1 Tax=Nonomuraea sp. NPDC050404 TaxID=3155783 RepID=UPI0033D7575C
MIDVVRATDLGDEHRRAITEIFVDGFGPEFSAFSKDPARLTDAFEHALPLDLYWVALVDGEPAGITALTDGTRLSFRHDGRELRRHLGLLKGTFADLAFRSTFSATLPSTRDGLASLEFVATRAKHRGRGVGAALLSHLLALPQYDEYVLEEISDINAPALHLYEKLGFREYKRKKVYHTRWSGINYYISMRLVQG